MGLNSLRILHLPKRAGAEAPLAGPERAFRLETCQRTLVFYSDTHGEDYVLPQGAELLSGVEAYRFMLRVATGLESEVKGETDIFGQLKQAWTEHESRMDPCSADAGLGRWMQKIFEDSKEIRALHLQNVGGGSYGSLVRKLLRKHSTGPQESILLVGAGHIARSIAPLLTEYELWISNRSLESARELGRELSSRHGARVRMIVGEDEERQAWREACHAVVCVPLDPSTDPRRLRDFEAGLSSAGGRSVVHLGGLRQACGEWTRLPQFHCLDDLFELQKSQDAVREEQFARAHRACDEKALLRSLSGHGWEDLAAFA